MEFRKLYLMVTRFNPSTMYVISSVYIIVCNRDNILYNNNIYIIQ